MVYEQWFVYCLRWRFIGVNKFDVTQIMQNYFYNNLFEHTSL
jgi:hypothetical protein